MTKHYSEDDKLNILALAITTGYPKRKGSIMYSQKVTGADHRTIKKWFKTVNIDKLEIKIMDLKQLIEKELSEVFDIMNDKRETASYRDLTTAAGVLSDKLILLNGGATNRTETYSGTWKDIVESAKNEDKSKPYKPEMEYKDDKILEQ